MPREPEWYPLRSGRVEATVYHQLCSFMIGSVVGLLIVYVSWWFITLAVVGVYLLNRWYFKKIREIREIESR